MLPSPPTREPRRSTSRGLDDLAARFEREAIPLRGQLYRAARRYTRTHADAEDLVQETMVRAYVGFSTFRHGTNIRAWLYTIMTRTWMNAHRAAQRRPAECLADDLGELLISAESQRLRAGRLTAEEEALQLIGDVEVRQALQKLPTAQQLAVYYADVEGFRYKEIAQILDIPMGSVMSRVHRGRQNMRKLLMGFAIEQGYVRVEGDVTVAA